MTRPRKTIFSDAILFLRATGIIFASSSAFDFIDGVFICPDVYFYMVWKMV